MKVREGGREGIGGILYDGECRGGKNDLGLGEEIIRGKSK